MHRFHNSHQVIVNVRLWKRFDLHSAFKLLNDLMELKKHGQIHVRREIKVKYLFFHLVAKNWSPYDLK